jgi:hypothetical protein
MAESAHGKKSVVHLPQKKVRAYHVNGDGVRFRGVRGRARRRRKPLL